MPSASSLFLLSFCFRNLLLEKYSRNALEIFVDFLFAKTKYQTEGEPERRPTGQRSPLAAAQGGPTGGARLAPGTSPRRPSTPINFYLT